jgi:hypothetical protein
MAQSQSLSDDHLDSDVLHEFGKDPEWNERFYFNFYDKARDIFAFMRIGLKRNMNEKAAFCFLMMPDRSILGWKDQVPAENNELAAGNLRFEKILVEKRWHLAFSGAMERRKGAAVSHELVSFSADYDCLNRVFDYRDCVSGVNEKVSEKVATQHLEQFGRINGTLTVGTKEYALDGLGERDHSWGVRDWNAPKMWIWLTCQFSEKCALNVTKLVMDAGAVDAGFVHLDGENVALTSADIETSWDADNEPKGLEMSLKDKNGKTHKVRVDVMRKVVVPFASRDGRSLSLMHENLARYEMNSQVGYGVAEYLIRTR